jgi:COP9 signalosome complex subunit 2
MVARYKNDPRIAAMTDLVDAYQREDIARYASVLQNNKDFMSDPFISENIDEVTRSMRMKAVEKIIAPYTRFSLDFIGKQLRISILEAQDLLGFLIVTNKVRGKINQHTGTVEMETPDDLERMHSLMQWSTAVTSLSRTVLVDLEPPKFDDSGQLFGGAGSRSSFLAEGLDLSSARGFAASGPSKAKIGVKSKGASGRLPVATFK